MNIAKLLEQLTPATMAEIKPYKRSVLPNQPKHPKSHNYADYARLDAMESPYSFKNLPDELHTQWLDLIKEAEVNRYPPELSQEMRVQLYDYLGIDKSMEFIAGNGSDELIMLLMLLCGTARGGKVVSPSPSFSMYRHLTQALGGEFIGVDLNADFTLDLDKFAAEIKQHRPQLVFLSQPNNPTGNLFPQEAAEIAAELLQDSGLVVVDRAYEFFSRSDDGNEDSSYPQTLAAKYPNLINLYTLSKIGVAGLRFGFAMGHKEVVNELSKLRLPYNINTLTCASIEFMADNLSHFTKWADEIKESRDELSRQMMQMPGIQVFPSSTNFLLFRLLGGAKSDVAGVDGRSVGSGVSAVACVDYLQQNKVLIKSFDGYHKSLKNCLRVSLGTEDENSLFLKQLGVYLKLAG